MATRAPSELTKPKPLFPILVDVCCNVSLLPANFFPQSLLMFAAVFSVAGCSLWDVGIKEIIDTADRTGIHDMKYKVEATAQASVTWKLVLYKVAAVILSFQPGRLQFFETSFDPTVRHTVWTQVQHK